MTTAFDSFDESPLGAFVQTPLDARNSPVRTLYWAVVGPDQLASGVYFPQYTLPKRNLGAIDDLSNWSGSIHDYQLILVRWFYNEYGSGRIPSVRFPDVLPSWWEELDDWTGRICLFHYFAPTDVVYAQTPDWPNRVLWGGTRALESVASQTGMRPLRSLTHAVNVPLFRPYTIPCPVWPMATDAPLMEGVVGVYPQWMFRSDIDYYVANPIPENIPPLHGSTADINGGTNLTTRGSWASTTTWINPSGKRVSFVLLNPMSSGPLWDGDYLFDRVPAYAPFREFTDRFWKNMLSVPV